MCFQHLAKHVFPAFGQACVSSIWPQHVFPAFGPSMYFQHLALEKHEWGQPFIYFQPPCKIEFVSHAKRGIWIWCARTTTKPAPPWKSLGRQFSGARRGGPVTQWALRVGISTHAGGLSEKTAQTSTAHKLDLKLTKFDEHLHDNTIFSTFSWAVRSSEN